LDTDSAAAPISLSTDLAATPTLLRRLVRKGVSGVRRDGEREGERECVEGE
jgi:hypothetical protein